LAVPTPVRKKTAETAMRARRVSRVGSVRTRR
jgi:hypothetical protein